jgi:hypothetical protein
MDTLSTKVYTKENGTTTTTREMALSDLKELVKAAEHDLYDLKVQARKAFGSLPTAEVFMEIYVASFRTTDPDGWFFKDYNWWWQKHGLSERNVKTGVKNLLKAKVIEKRNGRGNKMYFRMLPAAVIEKLYPDSQDETSELTDRQIQSGRNVSSGEDKTS